MHIFSIVADPIHTHTYMTTAFPNACLFQQDDMWHCNNCSGIIWVTGQRVYGVDLALDLSLIKHLWTNKSKPCRSPSQLNSLKGFANILVADTRTHLQRSCLVFTTTLRTVSGHKRKIHNSWHVSFMYWFIGVHFILILLSFISQACTRYLVLVWTSSWPNMSLLQSKTCSRICCYIK